MIINSITCGNCGGIGSEIKYTHIPIDDKYAKLIEAGTYTCAICGGKGCVEHAVFSVEEAKAILEHCGLPVEVE